MNQSLALPVNPVAALDSGFFEFEAYGTFARRVRASVVGRVARSSGFCPCCKKEVRVNSDGTLSKHRHQFVRCDGSDTYPELCFE